MVEEARVSPQLNTDSIEAVWGTFIRLLGAAGDTVLRGPGRAGGEIAARVLAPLIHQSVNEMQASGALDATAEIVNLSQLEEDWDADEGRPATAEARDLALHFLLRTFLAARDARRTWMRPAVSTAGDGGVDLLWSGARRRVLIVVGAEPEADGVIRVVQTEGAAPERAVVPLSEAVEDVVRVLRGT
jgi:hypothetical protein